MVERQTQCFIARLDPLLHESDPWRGVIEPLNDKARFAEFTLDKELETIVWPIGADFAPEFLYQKLRPEYALKSTHKSSAA